MTPEYAGLTFNIVRDVKAPCLGSDGAAGIDFYIPEYNKKNAVDLFMMNYHNWKTPYVVSVFEIFGKDRSRAVPICSRTEELVAAFAEGKKLSDADYDFIFGYLDQSAVFRKDIIVDNGVREITLRENDSLKIPSGVYARFPKKMCLLFLNRGGMATNTKVVRGACLDDSDYQGEIFLQFYTYSNMDVKLKFGSKVIQAIYIPYENEFEVVHGVPLEEFYPAKTERGEGCLGSTNSKK